MGTNLERPNRLCYVSAYIRIIPYFNEDVSVYPDLSDTYNLHYTNFVIFATRRRSKNNNNNVRSN